MISENKFIDLPHGAWLDGEIVNISMGNITLHLKIDEFVKFANYLQEIGEVVEMIQEGIN